MSEAIAKAADTIIDGKAFAAGIRAKVAARVIALKKNGLTPGLAVVLVGDDPASQVYVRNKGRLTREAGMHSEEIRLPSETPEAELVVVVEKLNADPAIHGILVQMPLPKHIDEQRIIGTIDPLKDVDGLHPINAGRLAAGLDTMVPCTPLGCLMLLQDRLGDLSGKRALVLGRSVLVGKPMGQLLLNANCTVTMAHSRTKDLADECRRADILVVAVGKPEMVRGNWVKPGAAVIDVGINRTPGDSGKDKLVGDVCFAEVVGHAGAITPVPGGVGPMTIACLLVNTVTAACRQTGVPVPDA